jgi:zinc transport system substrate-binding protein
MPHDAGPVAITTRRLALGRSAAGRGRRAAAAFAVAAVSAAVSTAALSGCGSLDPGAEASGDGATVAVVAAFYPLQWVTQQIGGEAVTVSSLTKPGAEPHDLELAPSDVAAIVDADLVVYLSSFQPAVDEAIEQNAPASGFDVRPSAAANLPYTPTSGGDARPSKAAAFDPHFWLDPSRLGAVATEIADRLEAIDPAAAPTFQANLASLRQTLAGIDADFRSGLADCANRDLVTSHAAFGYLAARYDLTQVGISGLSADSEPSPGALAEVSDFVRAHDVRTIYYETLVSPDIADTVARETGASTAVLDPIEGVTEDSPGRDYVEIMRANLATLRAGQACR